MACGSLGGLRSGTVHVGVAWLVAVHAGRVLPLHSLACGLWCAETRGPIARSPIAWWPQSGHALSFVAWGVALTFCPSCLRLQLGYALLSPTAPPLPISTSSSMAHVLSRFLRQQVAAGYMMGPFDPQECSMVVTSSIGVVPKSTPGKFTVIIDLSRPEGATVNDQLHWELTHVAYSSIEDALLAMHALGQGFQLAKIDILDAYRIIPVYLEEQPFMALSWEGRVYIDCQLPFGLASAPAIFSAVAEALEWVLRRRGVRGVLRYLDDFLLLGAPGSPECSNALVITFATCEELGVPLAMDKGFPWPWTKWRSQQ